MSREKQAASDPRFTDISADGVSWVCFLCGCQNTSGHLCKECHRPGRAIGDPRFSEAVELLREVWDAHKGSNRWSESAWDDLDAQIDDFLRAIADSEAGS